MDEKTLLAGSAATRWALAARSSDYSTFGSETTTKVGVRWRPVPDLLFRAAVAEGFRAPSIGELFGSLSRFDATIADPCSDFNNTGASQTVIDNCIAEGVPADGSYVQLPVETRSYSRKRLTAQISA